MDSQQNRVGLRDRRSGAGVVEGRAKQIEMVIKHGFVDARE